MVPDFVCFSFTLLLEMKMAISMGFPHSSLGKESACNVGDLGWIPGLGRSPGEGKGYPLQYSGLENSMDCIVHGVTKIRTQLSDFHFSSLHNKAILIKKKNRLSSYYVPDTEMKDEGYKYKFRHRY